MLALGLSALAVALAYDYWRLAAKRRSRRLAEELGVGSISRLYTSAGLKVAFDIETENILLETNGVSRHLCLDDIFAYEDHITRVEYLTAGYRLVLYIYDLEIPAIVLEFSRAKEFFAWKGLAKIAEERRKRTRSLD